MDATFGSFIRQAAAQAGGFFQWWLQELREARSALLDRYRGRGAQAFSLDLSGKQAVLVAARADGPEPLGIVLTETGLPPLPSIFPQSAPVAAQTEIVLAPADVLMFQLRFPPLSDRDLAAAVALQLEKELPLPAAQVSVDWRVMERGADRSRSVEVAVARVARVAYWRDQIRSWGWNVTRIGARCADGEVRFNLAPRSTRKLNLAVGRRELTLLAVAAGLGVVYVSVIMGQWIYERTALAERVAEAREQVTQLEQLKAQLQQERLPIESLRAMIGAPNAGQALVALSKGMPRDSWLYQIDVRALAPPLTIAAEGYAPTAAALPGSLEQHLTRVELLEVTNVGVGESRDRVKLRAGLREASQP